MTHSAHIDYLLRIGDNALILGQRLSEWCGHGPALEEDIALANIALDLIGQARMVLSHAGSLMSPTRTEDALSFLRDPFEFRNFTMLELPNSGIEKGQQQRDYAFTITRNFLFSAYAVEQWQTLCTSTDQDLADIAAKSLKEARYHLRHSIDWMLRFGDGTDESHRRAQAALDALWPYANEFFSDDTTAIDVALQGIGFTGTGMKDRWSQLVSTVLVEATLTVPTTSQFFSTGKLGHHSEHFGFLLAEMQSVARAHPGAQW